MIPPPLKLLRFAKLYVHLNTPACSEIQLTLFKFNLSPTKKYAVKLKASVETGPEHARW